MGRPIGERRQDGRGEWVQPAQREAKRERESESEDEREGEMLRVAGNTFLSFFSCFLSDDGCGVKVIFKPQHIKSRHSTLNNKITAQHIKSPDTTP